VHVQTKLAIYIGAGIALSVLAILLRSGRVLALTAPLFVYASALIGFDMMRQKQISVWRRLETSLVEEGQHIHVTLTAKNRGRSAVWLGLSEKLPSKISLMDGETSLLALLAPAEQTSISYVLQAPRGSYSISRVEMVTCGTFIPILYREHFLAKTLFRVFPRIEPLEELLIRPRNTRIYAGNVKAGINEFEQERVADVSIILDARKRANTSLNSQEVFDCAVRAAASISSHLLTQGNNVGLLIYGGYINWTYPGYGKLQQQKILDALSCARIADKPVFEHLHRIPTGFFSPRSQLVVVSPLAGVDDIEVLGMLHARGYQIVVVAPRPFPSQCRQHKADPNLAFARRILKLKRSFLLDTLTRIGIVVVDWNTDTPLSHSLSRVLSRQARRYR
jgi:uncharacterized protein (DUF58 family)